MSTTLHAVGCFHGGVSIGAVGNELERLDQRREVVPADVLDAWFEPAPGVVEVLQQEASWLARTSPPADCAGLLKAVSRARGVPEECLVPGAGSSDLIFRALRQWITPGSKVAILDPMYGEYAHVLERVIGCDVERVGSSWEEGYAINLDRLGRGVDWVVMVNPNSPTGRHIPREEMERWLRRVPVETRVWIDETYVDYVGEGESLEQFAAESRNVVVCKSMSKVYALSGMRVGYLCGPADWAREIIGITPPWVVGLAAQVAAVRALADRAYYRERYRQTHDLRKEMASALREVAEVEVMEGVANFVLVRLKQGGPSAGEMIARCREWRVFLRDASTMGRRMGDSIMRIAVRSAQENARVVEAMKRVIKENPTGEGGAFLRML